MTGRRGTRRAVVLPSGVYRVLGSRHSAAAAARAAHAAGVKWTRLDGRYLLVEDVADRPAVEGGRV